MLKRQTYSTAKMVSNDHHNPIHTLVEFSNSVYELNCENSETLCKLAQIVLSTSTGDQSSSIPHTEASCSYIPGLQEHNRLHCQLSTDTAEPTILPEQDDLLSEALEFY